MTDPTTILGTICLAGSIAFSLGVAVGRQYEEHGRERAIFELDLARQRFADLEPLTVRVGTELYDQELES